MRVDLGFLQFKSWNDNSGFLYKDPHARKGFWIRFFGWGIHVTNSQPLFMERNGFVKTYKLPRGYRFRFLRK